MTLAHIVGLSCSLFEYLHGSLCCFFLQIWNLFFSPIISRECENVYFSQCDCHYFVLLLRFIHFLFLYIFSVVLCAFLDMLFFMWVHCICGALYM